MKWCKSFFFVFCFVFASSGFAEPPKLDDLKKVMLFLKNEINHDDEEISKGKYAAWSSWAESNSYVSERSDFLWRDHVFRFWNFTEKTLTLDTCNDALQLFRRKQGVERWEQGSLSFVCAQEKLTKLLDDVGVRAEISNITDDGVKYDWAIIPGGALFRVESRINCLSKLYKNQQVEKFIMAGADRVLSEVDNKYELLSSMSNNKVGGIFYDLVEKNINTEMDGMFFMAMLMLTPEFDFSSMLSESATTWGNQVLRDVVFHGLRNKSCLSVNNLPANKMTMKISYAKRSDRGRATTMDNVAAICRDNPDIATKKLALLSTQPHAHYQEEMFKKEFNKVNDMKGVDITVLAPPIDDRILLIEQLNALHQWLQESLSSS
ncbi:MAG: hypothetical protein QS721_06695 [Candidatus Endonucleobacter sp. (ex Gigantidas childressi)]|nr:hypothetical protein [Candidatus Endonucleobacter sp. (ex Gigantidas childressi)]